MKYIVILLASCAFVSSAAFARTPSRDALIGQVEAAYTQAMILTPDSPVIDLFLGQARAANPGVSSATWSAIRRDLSSAISKVLLEQGGMIDVALRQSMGPLSDQELQKLSLLLADPTYRKFQAAMASRAAQKQIMQALMASSSRMGTVVNKILAMHGLKEAP